MKCPRLTACLLASCLLTVSACGEKGFENVVGGAAVGGAAGAMGGAVCCGDPVNTTGKGAVIGVVVGAVIGFVVDWYGSD